MDKSLLDTDIYSEILKGLNTTVIRNAIVYRRAHGRLTLSAVTVMEVICGFRRKQDLRRENAFLDAIALEEVLPFDSAVAKLAGAIAGDLDRTGQTIGTADPMIAAIAIQSGIVLITGNTSHFRHIQELGYPLRLENWRE